MADRQQLFEEPAAVASLAVVSGEPYVELPRPFHPAGSAARVSAVLRGPLDLLLYLIRRHDLDIMDVPITDICEQYAQYIELMQEMELELAGEYLVMAATLAEIKSRMLVPQLPLEEEDEEDPRARLFQRLLEYERLKQLAARPGRASPPGARCVQASADALEDQRPRELPQATLNELALAYARVIERVRFSGGWRCRPNSCRCASVCRTFSSRFRAASSPSSPSFSIRPRGAWGRPLRSRRCWSWFATWPASRPE